MRRNAKEAYIGNMVNFEEYFIVAKIYQNSIKKSIFVINVCQNIQDEVSCFQKYAELAQH